MLSHFIFHKIRLTLPLHLKMNTYKIFLPIMEGWTFCFNSYYLVGSISTSTNFQSKGSKVVTFHEIVVIFKNLLSFGNNDIKINHVMKKPTAKCLNRSRSPHCSIFKIVKSYYARFSKRGSNFFYCNTTYFSY